MTRSFLIVCFGVIVTFLAYPSCKKDAKCDCAADSIKIFRVYQPDGALGKDAIIESINPNTNHGGLSLFSVFSWTNNGAFDTARVLLEFDLTEIPAQTRIKTASLSLYWKSYGNLIEHTGENAFSIYRITQVWDENSVTWKTQPVYSSLHSISVPKSTSTSQSYHIDVTPLVQDMIDARTESHGFLLKLDNEFPYRLVVLASSDDVEPAKRPKLTVAF